MLSEAGRVSSCATCWPRPCDTDDYRPFCRRKPASEPVPGLLLTPQARGEFPSCGCRACAQGDPIAGHCIDIDGDYWHDCPATAPARGPSTPAPTIPATPRR